MAISPLLYSLLNAEFNTSHYHDKNSEKAHFCVDCGGESLSKEEMDTEHNGHRVLTTMKHSGHHCYKKQELLSLGPDIIVDLSGVRIYSVNSEDVVFIRSSAKEKQVNNIGKFGCCFTCGRPMTFRDNKPALYCSLSCKFGYTAYLEDLTKLKHSLKEKKRKMKRKREEKYSSGVKTLKIKQGNSTIAIIGDKIAKPEKLLGSLIDTPASVAVDDGKKLLDDNRCQHERIFANLQNTVEENFVKKKTKFDYLIDAANMILGPCVRSLIY